MPSLRTAVEGLLEQHGLSGSSDERTVAKVRKRLELARDLEGIDTSLIIDGDGSGRPSRRGAARVDYKCVWLCAFGGRMWLGGARVSRVTTCAVQAIAACY